MNKSVIVAFVIAIFIFAIVAVYGLVNQDYLKSVEKTRTTTTTTAVKTSQECTKKDGNKTIKYIFYLNKDTIEKINVSYENMNDAEEFNVLKTYLTESFGGITNKHLLGSEEKYVFTFDVNEISESLNELEVIKKLNMTIYNTNNITEYVVKLDENNYTC